MFLSNRAKYYLTLTFFLCFGSSCGWTSFETNANRAPANQLQDHLPFSTREPEKFVADVVISAGESQQTVRVIRDGQQRRYDYDYGSANQLSVISGQRNVSLLPSKKVFTETNAAGGQAAADDPFTINLLRQQNSFAEFEELGTENNVSRYSASVEGNNNSKVIVYVDRSLGIPIKEEFYSVENGKDILRYAMEIRNFQTEVDDSLFGVPRDYKKVSPTEFQSILKTIK